MKEEKQGKTTSKLKILGIYEKLGFLLLYQCEKVDRMCQNREILGNNKEIKFENFGKMMTRLLG